MKFINTDTYPTVDWEKEIVEEVPENSEDLADKISGYLMSLQTMEATVLNSAESYEPHQKANSIRMIEYLYCKFSFFHHHFTRKFNKKDTIDLRKELEEYDNSRHKHPVVSVREIIGEFDINDSVVPVEKIEEIHAHLESKRIEKKEAMLAKDGGFDEAKKLFKKEGLDVVEPVGRTEESDRDTCCYEYDGVRYHIYLMKYFVKERTQDTVKEKAEKLRDMIRKNHALIKKVYLKMKEDIKDTDNLWVLCGGGLQQQAFFGDERGYIGILYISENSTLVFQSCEDEEKWKEYKNFKVPGVTCESFSKTSF